LLVCSAFLFVSSPFSLSPSPPHHHLHSFPTRRSSDLRRVRHSPLHGRRLRRQLLLQQSRRLHGEPLRSLVHPPAPTVRHPPGDRERSLRGQRSRLPPVRSAAGQGDPPLRRRLGSGRRPR